VIGFVRRDAMSDASRPSELFERAKGLRARAADFDQRLFDPQAKTFIQTHESHHFAHADRFLDTDATARPTEMCETIWRDSADEMLRISKENFATFELEVQRHFGSRVEAVQLVEDRDRERYARYFR